jgi:hypothetical protein
LFLHLLQVPGWRFGLRTGNAQGRNVTPSRLSRKMRCAGRDWEAVALSATSPRPNGCGKLPRAKAPDRVKIEVAAGRDDKKSAKD